VVRPAEREREVGVVERVEPEAGRAVQHSLVDALDVHVGEAGLGIDAAVAVRGGLHDPLGCPRAAAGARRDEAAVDLVARGAALVDAKVRAPALERRVQVLVPERIGLEHVAVEIDHRVPVESHRGLPFPLVAR
jgi:hypothetical protein